MRQQQSLRRRASRRCAFALVSACAALHVSGTTVRAASGTWIHNGSGSWSNPANWVGGNIPKNQGDRAIIGSALSGYGTITVDGPFTVGSLSFASPSAAVYLDSAGGGILTLDGGSLSAGITVSAGAQEIFAPLVFSSAVTVNSSVSYLTLSGQLTGPGNVTCMSSETLIFRGPNLYTGRTTVQSGTLFVGTNIGLGAATGSDADGTRVEPGGTLIIANGVTVAKEKITLNGGTLQLPSVSSIINGPIFLAAPSTINGYEGSLTMGGEISGSAALTLSANNLTLNGANTYSGKTVVKYGNVIVNGTLGASGPGNETIVNGGALLINKATDDQITVDGGTVNLRDGTTTPFAILNGGVGLTSMSPGPVTYTGPFTVISGSISAGLATQTFNLASPITLVGGGRVIIGNGAASGTLDLTGLVSGSGSVSLSTGATLSVSTGLAQRGDLMVGGANGTCNLNVPNSYSGSTTCYHGLLNINDPAALPATTALTVQKLGVANLGAPNSVSSLHMTGGLLSGGNSQTLTIANPIDLQAGTINACLSGAPSIIKSNVADAVLTKIGASFAPTIDVQQGRLQVNDPAGLGASSSVVVSGAAHAVFDLVTPGPITQSVSLNNATGFAYTGALTSSSASLSTVLQGNLDLGSSRSLLGGNGTLSLAGSVTGGGLTKVGSNTVQITGNANTYTGETRVGLNGVGGALSLSGNGQLASTSDALLNPGGVLDINNASAISTDRLGDGIPVQLRGGTLRLTGPSSVSVLVTETVGPVTLKLGSSALELNGGVNNQTLTITSLSRLPGSTLNIACNGGTLGGAAPNPQVNFTSVPTLKEGILPYATVGNVDFATIGPNGLQAFSNYNTGPETTWTGTGSLTSNAAPGSNTVLSANRHLNSLALGNATINLNGFELNVESGAILDARYSNHIIGAGTLTAGGSGDGELILHVNSGTFFSIASSISDNSDGGIVGLTKSGPGELHLSGANSYTGDTIVTGGLLLIDAPAAFPSGGNLTVTGTYLPGANQMVVFTNAGSGTVVMGAMTLADGNATVSGTPIVRASTYNLQSGRLSIGIAGSGTMTKSSDNTLLLSSDNPTYSGVVSVNGGILNFSQPKGLGIGAVTVNAGGRLVNSACAPVANPLRLSGGELAAAGCNATFSGSVSVSADSTILTFDGLATSNPPARTITFTTPLSIGTGATLGVSGNGTIVLTNNMTLSGGLQVAQQSTVIAGNLDGTGAVTVGAGASLTGSHVRVASVSVSGEVDLAANGTSTGTSRMNALAIAGATDAWTGILDLRDNDLVIDYSGGPSPLATVQNQLKAGYNSGSWTGKGLTSSTAATTASGTTVLGYAEASALFSSFPAMFSGQNIDNTCVLVKYTYYGDANLDGRVDINDLGNLATNWQTSNVWTGGDFNYDGFVDVSDLGKLATNWQAGVGSPLGPDSLQAALTAVGLGTVSVPEPGAEAVALAALCGLTLRRRQAIMVRR